MARDDIDALLAGIGELDDTIEGVLKPSETEYVVLYGETAVDISYDEDEDKLVFSVGMGIPAAGRADDAHRLLLRYAGAWRQTGGIGAGITGTDGAMVLTMTAYAPRLDSRKVVTIVTGLAQRAAILRAMMDSSQVGEESREGEDFAPGLEGFIRI